MKTNLLQRLKKTNRNVYSIIIGLGILLYWRGLWGLLDLYLFPGNELISYSISIVVGLAILFFNDFRLREMEK
ncbi:hypothetical protein HOD19_04215 [bacterium]|jgi:hypothetical protein|nr:hypothetical protein [bacterium]MBT4648766.1 hypothetical protein [bacterium]